MIVKTIPAFAALAMLTMPLAAQQPAEQLTYVALYKVKPGKGQAWEDMFKKHFVPMYAKLMAEGTVTGFGMDSDVLHQPGTPNADVWYTMPNYAAFDKVRAALDKVFAGLPAAEAKERFDLTDPEKHMDYLFQSTLWKSKPVALGTKPVTHISIVQAQPGKAQDLRKRFEKESKPVYDKLLADGVILYYSLDLEDIHSRNPGTSWLVVTAPNMAAFDKVNAAFDAQREKQTPAERSISNAQWRELTVPAEHRDYLTEASVYTTK
jgi:hypothetical protein